MGSRVLETQTDNLLVALHQQVVEVLFTFTFSITPPLSLTLVQDTHGLCLTITVLQVVFSIMQLQQNKF